MANKQITIYNSTYIVDPYTRASIGVTANGNPNITAKALDQNKIQGVIGFKVPQGVKWLISANPLIQMALYQDTASTIQLSQGDTILIYAKTPADSIYSLGTEIGSIRYTSWWQLNNVGPAQQAASYNQSSIVFPIDHGFSLTQNYILVFAIATQNASETIDFTGPNAQLLFPVNEVNAGTFSY